VLICLARIEREHDDRYGYDGKDYRHYFEDYCSRQELIASVATVKPFSSRLEIADGSRNEETKAEYQQDNEF